MNEYVAPVNVDTLADKVRAFDARVGRQLLEKGYEALSMADHEQLRNWLEEAGYEVMHEDKIFGDKEGYNLDSKRLYSRPYQSCIDILAEQNLANRARPGFTYLQVKTFKQFKDFQDAYARAHRYSDAGANLTSLGCAGMVVGSVTAFFEPIIGISIAVGSAGIGIAIPAVVESAKKERAMLRAWDLAPVKTTNIREAILQAFHLPHPEPYGEIIGIEALKGERTA